MILDMHIPSPDVPALTQADIDQRVFDLYDEYCHGRMDRRELFDGGVVIAGGLAMAQALMPRYARAQTISFTDERIKARYVTYPSPAAIPAPCAAISCSPRAAGRFPAVLVIHENRGLNPYIEDVARRVAVEGFLALAPDGLAPVGGYPGNDDDGRDASGQTRPGETAHRHAEQRALSEGACAVERQARRDRLLLGRRHDQLPGRRAGRGPAGRGAVLRRGTRDRGGAAIKATLLIHYAENDERINAMWPAYEAALKASGVPYEMYTYPGTQHGFHNNSTPRYQEAAAKLAWDRTVTLFKQRVG